MILHKKILSFFFLLLLSFHLFSQDTNNDDIDTTATSTSAVTNKNMKGFHIGVYAGTLFANKYTTSMYDGYGFNVNGVKNNFDTSFLRTQLVYVYGGGYGQADRIAQALNVNHTDWQFNSQDMPINLKYNVAFTVGLNTRYCFDKKRAIIFNANGSKLTVNGDFTIETTGTSTVSSTGNATQVNIQTFAITGGEQRLMMQLGYQYIVGDNDNINFFIEGGIDVTLVKYLKNVANVNGLLIDVGGAYSYPYYNSYRKHLTSVGPGAFAGMGLNLSMSPKYTIQLLYTPSYDLINIGDQPKYKLQNSIGLRAYYNL